MARCMVYCAHMEAMIFAAGLGTRLRPLTDNLPKALVEVRGVPMLERVARRLVEAGAERLVINAHHHAGQIAAFVESRDGFGVEAIISDESAELLDTGGGLLYAARHFRSSAPFILHNADVYTGIDLRAMYAAHDERTLATLAVMGRDSSRYLLFDRSARLTGYGNAATGFEHRVHDGHYGEEGGGVAEPEETALQRFGFCGIHVISPRIFELIEERGSFPIIPLYMRLARAGHRIAGHDVGSALWIDIGTIDRLEHANSLAS